jgi:hypothetical protein
MTVLFWLVNNLRAERAWSAGYFGPEAPDGIKAAA